MNIFIKVNNKIKTFRKKWINKFLFSYYYNKLKNDNFKISDKIDESIIVSITSFSARFSFLPLTVKSILYQSVRPIYIYIYVDETNGAEKDKLQNLKIKLEKYKIYGVLIKETKEDLKPHKKYFYAMQEFKDKNIITCDDDVIYTKHLIKKLLKAHKKFPDSVCAFRTHLMTKTKTILNSYNNFKWNYKKISVPSHCLLATGIGGVLYPSGTLQNEDFDLTVIQNTSLLADDIYLKYCEIKNNKKVKLVKSFLPSFTDIPNSQEIALKNTNVTYCKNDETIKNCEKHFKINLADYAVDQNL